MSDTTLPPLPANRALEAYFPEARSKLLDLAAILDRIDRGDDAAVLADPRVVKLRAALELLLKAGPGRADEEKVPLDKLPKAVADGFKKRFPKADPTGATKEKADDGKTVYETNCAACHRADGGGLIGPNLTDASWIHGGAPTQVHHTIAVGVLEKGMPPWERILKPEQLNNVTAYVLSLQGTNPPNPKAPEGAVAAPASGT